jgi:Flp pilus assembly protein TadB
LADDRKRAREARLEARRHEVAAAAARREKIARRQAMRAKVTPTRKKHHKRYGALSTLQRAQLVLLFLLSQVAVWLFVPDLRLRLVIAVLTAAVLAVLVRTRRRPPR